jgi:DNA-binding Xre family transcriptional regulator
MTIRLRLLELMKARGYVTETGTPSAVRLVEAFATAKSKVGEATLYRLVRNGGSFDRIDASTLEALADHFGCDVADLFKRKKGSK